MYYNIKSACSSNMGKIRTNNEDNFLYDNKHLAMYNYGMKNTLEKQEKSDEIRCYAVFDGMGGESNGEMASFYAAETFKTELEELKNVVKQPKEFLLGACDKMNEKICVEAEKEKTFMGTTAAILYFYLEDVYVCNIGDSKVYRLRDNTLMQISEDHVQDMSRFNKNMKPALTQNLGIPPEEMKIEPYIAKGVCRTGDKFLICSDGLTDMVTEETIYEVLNSQNDMQKCVSTLIDLALENGGKDNVTIITCCID